LFWWCRLRIALSDIAAAKAAKMRVAAIPDTRFVDPCDYKKEADYLLSSLNEIPSLIRKVGGISITTAFGRAAENAT